MTIKEWLKYVWSSTSTGNIVWDTENAQAPHDDAIYLMPHGNAIYFMPHDDEIYLNSNWSLLSDRVVDHLIDGFSTVREALEKMSDELNNTSSPIQDAQFCKEQFYEMLGVDQGSGG